jgi:hypothetical protein
MEITGVKQISHAVREVLSKTDDYLKMDGNVYNITMKQGLSYDKLDDMFILNRKDRLKSNIGLYYPTNSGEVSNSSNTAYILPIDDIQHGFTNDVIQLLTKYDFTYHLSYNTFAFDRKDKAKTDSKDGNEGLKQHYIATYLPSFWR